MVGWLMVGQTITKGVLVGVRVLVALGRVMVIVGVTVIVTVLPAVLL